MGIGPGDGSALGLDSDDAARLCEYLINHWSPGQCGSVAWASPCKAEGRRFLSPVRAHARVAGPLPRWDMYVRQPIDVSLSHVFLPLSPPPTPSLKINKQIIF